MCAKCQKRNASKTQVSLHYSMLHGDISQLQGKQGCILQNIQLITYVFIDFRPQCRHLLLQLRSCIESSGLYTIFNSDICRETMTSEPQYWALFSSDFSKIIPKDIDWFLGNRCGSKIQVIRTNVPLIYVFVQEKMTRNVTMVNY